MTPVLTPDRSNPAADHPQLKSSQGPRQACQTLPRLSTVSPCNRQMGQEDPGPGFGPWADADAALQLYLDQRDDLYAGRRPQISTEGTSVRDLCNRFLTGRASGRVCDGPSKDT